MRIHEDAHVTSRPPRVPKSSPIVDSSNTRPLTVERKSVPEKLPPSQHSIEAQKSHFLSEFNVDACFDFRAIPDPPTPEPRNRRRLSTSVLPSMPQSHSESPNKSSRGVTLASDENLLRGSSKRSRKSLCHVPSPVVRSTSICTEQRDDPSLSSSPPPVAPKTLHVNICVDDDDDDDADAATSVKRRKKRQSMELPRELVLDNASALEASFAPPRAHIPPGPSQCQSLQNLQAAFIGDKQNMKDLQALVRGYCKVPKAQRSSSKEASAIEETTGYPLVTPDEIDHPLSLSNRRSVLQKMAPIIEEIDKRKAEDIAKWEYETECRVERSSKSGKYRYISIETNTKVGSQEYKRRYMGVLAREAPLRLAKTKEWKDKLNAPSPQACQEEASKAGMERAAIDAPLVTDHSGDMDDECENASFDTTQELDLDLNEILALDTKPSDETEQESLPAGAEQEEDTSMEICDMSVSMDLGEASEVRAEFQPSARMQADTPTKELRVDHANEEEDIELELVPEMTVTDQDCATKEECAKVPPKSVTPTEMELLPFPDRDEESKDPDIARAERRLWGRIDAALQDYSHEVMMIMNSRGDASN